MGCGIYFVVVVIFTTCSAMNGSSPHEPSGPLPMSFGRDMRPPRSPGAVPLTFIATAPVPALPPVAPVTPPLPGNAPTPPAPLPLFAPVFAEHAESCSPARLAPAANTHTHPTLVIGTAPWTTCEEKKRSESVTSCC